MMDSAIALKRVQSPVVKTKRLLSSRNYGDLFSECILHMSAPGTTDLADLPVLPIDNEPVQLHMTEKNTVVDNPVAKLQEERELDTKEMNALVTSIQSASAVCLQLPQKDVPQNQDHLTQDSQVRANYIPSPGADYIGPGPTSEEIMRQHSSKQKAQECGEQTLDMLQIPIILYSVFCLSDAGCSQICLR